jgi:hypothetical protein
MDYILATDWLHNAYAEIGSNNNNNQDENKENIPPGGVDEMNWLKIIDEEEAEGKKMEG